MATKAKSTNGAKESVETIVNAGTGAMKDGYDKAVKGYDQLATFSRDTIEALVHCAQMTTKGMEAINTEALAFSRQSMEDGVAAAKSAMTAKTVQEWFEVQSEFTKSAFDAYMGQMTKISDLMANTTREAVEPLNDRFTAFVDIVNSQRTA